jgi:hypothetical protein
VSKRSSAAGTQPPAVSNSREQVENAAADQRAHRRHAGPRIAEPVQQEPGAVEVARAGAVGRTRGAAMRQKRQIERLRRIVKRVQIRVVEQFAAGGLRREIDADQIRIALGPVFEFGDP